MITIIRRICGGLVLPAAFVGALFLPAPAGALAQTDDENFAAAEAAFMEAADDEARLRIVRDFLEAHPDHPDAIVVVDVGVRLLADSMGDLAGAVALAESHLSLTTNPEVQAQIRKILLRLFSTPEYAAKLKALVADMYDLQGMSYVEHLAVIRAAIGAEDWSMVEAHCAAAASQATVEAYRAAYPDRDLSMAEVTAAARNRQGLLKTFTGWAAANQGDRDQALADFEAAGKLVRQSYFGQPGNELYRFWGQTLVMAGQTDTGLELLALATIYGNDSEAGEAARAAFADLGKEPEKFEEYLWAVAREHGPVIDDFTAFDYQEVSRSFNGLRGRKATLLAFWFPT